MTAGFDEERIGPFIVRRQPDVAIVVCPEYLDDTRAEKDEKSLLGVVDANKLVICDVSDTKEMAVNWLRFLARMSERSSAAAYLPLSVIYVAVYVNVSVTLSSIRHGQTFSVPSRNPEIQDSAVFKNSGSSPMSLVWTKNAYSIASF